MRLALPIGGYMDLVNPNPRQSDPNTGPHPLESLVAGSEQRPDAVQCQVAKRHVASGVAVLPAFPNFGRVRYSTLITSGCDRELPCSRSDLPASCDVPTGAPAKNRHGKASLRGQASRPLVDHTLSPPFRPTGSLALALTVDSSGSGCRRSVTDPTGRGREVRPGSIRCEWGSEQYPARAEARTSNPERSGQAAKCIAGVLLPALIPGPSGTLAPIPVVHWCLPDRNHHCLRQETNCAGTRFTTRHDRNPLRGIRVFARDLSDSRRNPARSHERDEFLIHLHPGCST